MVYAPGLSRGSPGQIIIDHESSIGALAHKYQHFLDDQAAGNEMMQDIGRQNVVEQLQQNLQNEIKSILGKKTICFYQLINQ